MGHGDQVLVVGEEDDLGPARQIGKRAQRGRGPRVVEVQQDVVDDEGDRLVALEPVLDAGDPQGQVELVAGAVAHGFQADRFGCAGSDAHQHGLAPSVKIGAEPLEGSTRHLAEELSGGIEDRPLVLLTVAFDGLAQHGRRQAQDGILANVFFELCDEVFTRFALFGRPGVAVHRGQLGPLAADLLVGLGQLLFEAVYPLVQLADLRLQHVGIDGLRLLDEIDQGRACAV